MLHLCLQRSDPRARDWPIVGVWIREVPLLLPQQNGNRYRGLCTQYFLNSLIVAAPAPDCFLTAWCRTRPRPSVCSVCILPAGIVVHVGLVQVFLLPSGGLARIGCDLCVVIYRKLLPNRIPKQPPYICEY